MHMKFVKENLTVLICAVVALLLVVAAFVYPIPSWKGDLVKEMNNDLGQTTVVNNLTITPLALPGLPEKKGVPSNAYIAAKAKAQADITAQKKSVEDAGRVANSHNRLSANRQPLLAAPTAANPENMVEEPNLLPKSQGGDALKFKADYMNQFRLWTGWLLKGTPTDMELNASMPPDSNELRSDWDAKQQQLQLEQASLKTETTAKVPVPQHRPKVLHQANPSPSAERSRMRGTNCARHTFSCEWPRLSESLNDLKKLFTSSSSAKAKKS